MPINTEGESLLQGHSSLLLYGRVLTDLTYTHQTNPASAKATTQPLGDNQSLQKQLGVSDARFARIYGFEYEGHYFDLPKPALFLVHGAGVDMNVAGLTAQPDPKLGQDIVVWEYDKEDFSLRLDETSGSLADILIAATLEAHESKVSGVSGTRVSGTRLKSD